ncbi:alpha/beta fold hydrolase [Streptomyces sp. SID3343]|uniref:thioesterase II family protein n=1 Tax=Streptomyces sp. SID3343 TaxID=2690260 RepID=UPI001369A3D7|nr:alpha/beta fold hydrolase [Streptomyces sp. SID3343]MYV97957.1 alpha/beta fold hydrolase [Streptomyces sp. SID3343]
MRPAEERWLRRFRDDDGGTKLVCFPHAGGWTSAYGAWPSGLPAHAGVLAVRYPGREDRLGDPFPSELDVLADDIADALEDLMRHRLVLFGHSMGASVAHEVALRLHKRGCPPAALIVSGRRPPHLLHDQRRFSGTDEEIIAGIVRYDASRAAVYAEPELRELLLPALRADYRLVDDYRGGHRPPLDCPVYGYTGADDPEAPPADMRGWADSTHDAFRLRVLPGGHFYLRAQETALLADIRDILGAIAYRAQATP